MFDLEQAVGEWRQKMLDAGIAAPVRLDELESHLRDAVAAANPSDVDVQASFEAAARQIGTADTINMEFRKLDSANEPFGQKFGEKYSAPFMALYLAFYTVACARAFMRVGMTSRELALASAGVAMTLIAWVAAWAWRRRRVRLAASGVISSRLAGLLAVSGVVMFASFVLFVIPHFQLTPAQLNIAITWGLVPALSLPALFLVVQEDERFGSLHLDQCAA
jgi:hypothetical protein